MKVTERQLRRIIREELFREDNENAGADADAGATTAAGKKLDAVMDSGTMNAFKVALDKATNKDSIKEILSQIFSVLGENGQKYLKQALKELAQEI